MRRSVVVMVKEPRAGRVKTRLGREIGMTTAAWWFRHQTARLLRRIEDPRWDLWLSVAPDTALGARVWPAHLRRMPQGRGDLGARMRRALAAPCGPTLVIGADIPGITPAHLARAFALLGAHDAVLGPAGDGGYWLIGVRGAPPHGLFDDVRWSTEHALADTVRSLGTARIAYGDLLHDVDVAADLPKGARPG